MDEQMMEGLELQELDADEVATLVPGSNQKLQGQLRRAGSAGEVPGPQRYRDYPAWLTAPNKNPALEDVSA